MLLTSLGLAFYFGWILSLVTLGYLPLIILSWWFSVNNYKKTEKEKEKLYSESDAHAQESLSAIKLVKQMNS